MRVMTYSSLLVLALALPAYSSLTPWQLKKIRHQAEDEARALLCSPGARAASAGATGRGAAAPVTAAVVDMAATRIEMHLRRAAAAEYWRQQSASSPARRLLAGASGAAGVGVVTAQGRSLQQGTQQGGLRPTAADAAPFCSLLANTTTHSLANDIPSAFVNTTDPGECCAACDFRLDCFAWTVKTGVSPEGCFLRGQQYSVSAYDGFTTGTMTDAATWVPPPTPPAFQPLVGGLDKYAQVLNESWYFFAAQRSGVLPASNPVPWRGNANVNDPVPGGWYNGGDFLKLNFPLGVSVSFIAWSLVDFKPAFIATGALAPARDALRVPLDYMLACYDEERQRYTGQIGTVAVDHAYWGRPEEMDEARPAFVWDKTMHASDLLSNAAAAFASASLAFRFPDPAYSALLLGKAKSIYAWAISNEGRYSDYYRASVYTVYPSTSFLDKQAWAAAWLYRATGVKQYLTEAEGFWARSYGRDPHTADVWPGWDSLWAPTAVVMRNLARGKVSVPGIQMYTAYWEDYFLKSWLAADGTNDVVRSPLGMAYPKWNIWSNLQFATTAAMLMAQDAQRNANAAERAAEVAFARTQVHYAMGSTGRSFVVGWGASPPANAHHAASSCPNTPAPCNMQNLYMKAPNPQPLYGALLGGPSGVSLNKTDPDYYFDLRTDFAVNEPTLDNQAGFVGAAAGLYALLKA